MAKEKVPILSESINTMVKCLKLRFEPGRDFSVNSLWGTVFGAQSLRASLWWTVFGGQSLVDSLWWTVFGAQFLGHRLWWTVFGGQSLGTAFGYSL